MEPLELWIERQYRHSAEAMVRSVSPVGIVKTRPGFGQIIRPCKGAIVASPVLAAYDPEPDYFFHWYRDSAVVVDALRVLAEDDGSAIAMRAHVADFVHFSLALRALDGRPLAAAPDWRTAVRDDFVQYLRTGPDLASVHGASVAAETRVNPDGTLDISSWPRPQYDGPALRALAMLRWIRSPCFDAALTGPAAALLRSDLCLTFEHWRDSCFDIWEEEKGQHYYTLRVAAAALADGADWLELHGDSPLAAAYRADALAISRILDGYWDAGRGYYRSRILDSGQVSSKDLDIAVILAAIHAAGNAPAHSVHDPRMHATLARLEALFGDAYPINRGRGPGRSPAMGRYAGDVYFSGGAYYFSTFGAAEFCFGAATGVAATGAAADSRRLIEHGDGFLETARAFAPQSGDLSEQFDQRTGEPRSARHLAWSYAAFISCIGARRRAQRSLATAARR
jgi:glycosyl hydrolase family 15